MVARRTIPVISDFAIAEDAHDHRKTKKARKTFGDTDATDFFRAWWGLTRLWRWGTCKGGPGQTWDGYLGDNLMTISDEAEWPGHPEDFVEALVELEFLEKRETGFWIHDFHDSQPHVSVILRKIEAKRASGRIGGLASGANRRSETKRNEANGKQTEAKRTPEAEADDIRKEHVVSVLREYNSTAKQVRGMSSCRLNLETNQGYVRTALARKDFRENWQEALENLRTHGLPEWWTSKFDLGTFLQKSALPKLLDGGKWLGGPKRDEPEEEDEFQRELKRAERERAEALERHRRGND